MEAALSVPESERHARLKRRRIARLVAVGAVLTGIVALAALSGPKTGKGRSGPVVETSPAPEAACGAEPPASAASPGPPEQYDRPPDMALQPGVDYSAIVHTSCGPIRIDLLERDARHAVNNFVFLARDGFYDGLVWHRVEPNAVMQTGDPNGEPLVEPDGPGYTIPDELPEEGREYVYGVVGMANAGPNTGGSQWFIVIHEDKPAGYDPLYPIFGRVDVDSYETLEAIEDSVRDHGTVGGPDPVDEVRPAVPIYIESIEIVEG